MAKTLTFALVLCLAALPVQAWDGRFYDHTGSGPSYDAGRGVRFLSLAKDDSDLSAFLFETRTPMDNGNVFSFAPEGVDLFYLTPTGLYLYNEFLGTSDDDIEFKIRQKNDPLWLGLGAGDTDAGLAIEINNIAAADAVIEWNTWINSSQNSIDVYYEMYISDGDPYFLVRDNGVVGWYLNPGISDAADAVAFTLNSLNTFSTSGAKLLSLQNAETEKFYVDKDGVIGAAAIQFDLTYTPVHSEGQLHWDDDDKTLEIDTEVTGTHIQIGQETVVRATNKTGVTITDGTAVYINGAQGNRPTIALADADAESTSYVVGLVTADIANNGTGYVTIQGIVRGYDTSGFTAGDALWVSSTAGALQNTPPAAPKHAAFVGHALNSLVDGAVLVRPNNGNEITELHDVENTMSPAEDHAALVYDASNTRWTSSEDHTYERHLQVPASIAGVGNTPTATVSNTDVLCILWNDTPTEEYAYFQFEVPSDWDNTTDWTVEVDWHPYSAAIGAGETVIWEYSYRSVAQGENFNQTSDTTSGTFTDGGAGTAQYLSIHTGATIPKTGTNQNIAREDHVYMRINRDGSAADTFGGTVCVSAFEILYNSEGMPRL